MNTLNTETYSSKERAEFSSENADVKSNCYWKSQPGLHLTQEHMESKEHSPKDQVKNLQIKCDQHSSLWIRVMEGDQNYQ